jgi:hypothetical protein
VVLVWKPEGNRNTACKTEEYVGEYYLKGDKEISREDVD